MLASVASHLQAGAGWRLFLILLTVSAVGRAADEGFSLQNLQARRLDRVFRFFPPKLKEEPRRKGGNSTYIAGNTSANLKELLGSPKMESPCIKRRNSENKNCLKIISHLIKSCRFLTEKKLNYYDGQIKSRQPIPLNFSMACLDLISGIKRDKNMIIKRAIFLFNNVTKNFANRSQMFDNFIGKTKKNDFRYKGLRISKRDQSSRNKRILSLWQVGLIRSLVGAQKSPTVDEAQAKCDNDPCGTTTKGNVNLNFELNYDQNDDDDDKGGVRQMPTLNVNFNVQYVRTPANTAAAAPAKGGCMVATRIPESRRPSKEDTSSFHALMYTVIALTGLLILTVGVMLVWWKTLKSNPRKRRIDFSSKMRKPSPTRLRDKRYMPVPNISLLSVKGPYQREPCSPRAGSSVSSPELPIRKTLQMSRLGHPKGNPYPSGYKTKGPVKRVHSSGDDYKAEDKFFSISTQKGKTYSFEEKVAKRGSFFATPPRIPLRLSHAQIKPKKNKPVRKSQPDPDKGIYVKHPATNSNIRTIERPSKRQVQMPPMEISSSEVIEEQSFEWEERNDVIQLSSKHKAVRKKKNMATLDATPPPPPPPTLSRPSSVFILAPEKEKALTMEQKTRSLGLQPVTSSSTSSDSSAPPPANVLHLYPHLKSNDMSMFKNILTNAGRASRIKQRRSRTTLVTRGKPAQARPHTDEDTSEL